VSLLRFFLSLLSLPVRFTLDAFITIPHFALIQLITVDPVKVMKTTKQKLKRGDSGLAQNVSPDHSDR
jgi:hypothetical protein